MAENKKEKLEELAEQFEVPVEGSLGLLALGASGIRIWRAARRKGMPETDDTLRLEHYEEE